MPRSIFRISIWNFSVVFEPHLYTNGKPFFFFFFNASYGRFCIFRTFISAISPRKGKRKKARLSICWLQLLSVVHNQHRVEKSHPDTLYWAGHGQFTSLAVTWLAQLVRTSVIAHGFWAHVGSTPWAISKPTTSQLERYGEGRLELRLQCAELLHLLARSARNLFTLLPHRLRPFCHRLAQSHVWVRKSTTRETPTTGPHGRRFSLAQGQKRRARTRVLCRRLESGHYDSAYQ